MEITIHDKTFVPFIDRYQLDEAISNMVSKIQQDYAEAMRWCMKAAEKGYVQSQYYYNA